MKHIYISLTLLFFTPQLATLSLAGTTVGISNSSSIVPLELPAYSLRDSFDLFDNVREEFESEMKREIKDVSALGFQMKEIKVSMEDDYILESSFDGAKTAIRVTAPGARVKWKIGGVCSGITRPKIVITYDNIVVQKTVESSGITSQIIYLRNLDTDLSMGINACGWLTLPILIQDGFGYDSVETWISRVFERKIVNKISNKLGLDDPDSSGIGGEMVINGIKMLPDDSSLFDMVGGKEAAISMLLDPLTGSKITLEFDEDGLTRSESADDILHIIIE